MPDPNAVNALILQMRKRKLIAQGLLAVAVIAWAIAAWIVTSMSRESDMRQVLVIVSIAWLVLGALGSIVLAIKNSYTICPKCEKPFYEAGLFAGYREPVGQKCDNCGFELRLQEDTDAKKQ